MSIRIKCGKTFGLMNDDMSINELMDYIVENCVRPGTEYFYLSFNHECIAEYRKGVVYTLSNKQNVHDIPGYWKGDFYVCFKSRFPKKDKSVEKEKAKLKLPAEDMLSDDTLRAAEE